MTGRCPVTLLLLGVLGCSGETRVDLLSPLERPDASARPDAAPASSSPHLIHRYSFNGQGSRALDAVGNADGSLENGATLDGAGHAVLDGSDDFVDLPNGLVSSLESVTLIVWLSWNGGPCWQRAFDFGSSDAGEGAVGNATSSLFVTPLRCPGTGPATAFQTSASLVPSVDSDAPFPVLQDTSLAVVVDATNRELRLYSDGVRLGSGSFAKLSGLTDENDWLGRSQWVQDTPLRGSFDEFRIYDVALDDAAIAALAAAGPDMP